MATDIIQTGVLLAVMSSINLSSSSAATQLHDAYQHHDANCWQFAYVTEV